MNQSEIYDRLTSIIIEKIAPHKRLDISMQASLDSLGFDSLDRVELIMMVEEEFSIAISDDSADLIKTIADAVNVIEQSLKSNQQ